MSEPVNIDRLARNLVKRLRRNVDDIKKCEVEPDGSVSLTYLATLLKYSKEDIHSAISHNERLVLTECGGRIRCPCGHSSEWRDAMANFHSSMVFDDDGNFRLTPYERLTMNDTQQVKYLFHGTTPDVIPLVLNEKSGGLKLMSRAFIHLADRIPKESEKIAGLRKTSQASDYIVVDLVKAIRDGIPFYRATSTAIMCPTTIPVQYLTHLSYEDARKIST